MTANRSTAVLELFRVLLGLAWWLSVTVVPLQIALSVLRAGTGLHVGGLGDMGVTVTLTDVAPAMGAVAAEVPVADLPLSSAIAVGLLWLTAVAVGLPVLRQLRRITHAMLSEQFDRSTARRMRSVGPLVALAAVAWFGLDAGRSAVAAAASPVPGTMLLSPQPMLWALAAAVGSSCLRRYFVPGACCAKTTISPSDRSQLLAACLTGGGFPRWQPVNLGQHRPRRPIPVSGKGPTLGDRRVELDLRDQHLA